MSKITDIIWSYLRGDKVVWTIVFSLFIVSMLAVYSATGTLAYAKEVSSTYYLFKQITLALFGLALMYVFHLIDYRYYSRISQILWVISIPLLIYTMFGTQSTNDANRWIRLPFVGLTFQTSDLAKLALIMLLARQLSLRQENIGDFRQSFVPTLIPVVVTCMLIAPENLSTALILFCTAVLVMFIGRIPIRHIALLTGAGLLAAGIFLAVLFLVPESWLTGRMPTWKNRIENYINQISGAPADLEEDYQVTQAKIAIAKGGLLKLNPGGSDQRNFLPQAYNDFIYVIIIEEYGVLGGAVLLFLYLFLLYRCIRIAIDAPKVFGALLAVGLGFALVIQAMVNMAVAVNLFPVTGVTLPLVSMGGSSVIFTSIAFGIILSVSRSVQDEAQTEPA
ncbi:MAG: FtsW/RodA/SpoVE family cell cycle protein [Chitinophagales bacterium]|nr:FtsW/RodA/SpoVE family cell cycle protein [Chitinophagales bacterium]MDW8418837.1 FtsW/RodA/SpoVE family cell cycle protein [Chitinophagales bacterium]